MIKRYKVLKDCLDANGIFISGGIELKFEDPICDMNTPVDFRKGLMLTKKALGHEEFFEEVKEEKAKTYVYIDVNFGRWVTHTHGQIEADKMGEFNREFGQLLMKYMTDLTMSREDRQHHNEL